ncbi:putative regulatory protein, FmdB family [Candidatus Kryptobacter tengchongensis]|nr:putative regulatory protein, FmdB family [Candidatus Kryptobacter tengchongensis]CUU09732.1 putative regulatory protein, FmdB family [Candidatus Kryptobacter tengchongensis]
MPTYEYKCDNCGYIFEEFQSINDEPVKICPKCGGSVRKVISGGIGLIFKGSGFYITDYKRGNSSKNRSNSETKSETKSEKSEQ